ncbi:MAG: diguanylate cyclase [Sphingomonadales bacterium]
MKIRDSAGTAAANRVTAARPAQRVAPVTDLAPAESVQDQLSVLDIPPEELTPRVRQALVKLLREVELLRREIDETHLRLSEMERLADTDSLAPIANRRAFVRELSRVISYSERYDVPASLVFLDVNGMKQINDEMGHSAGDAVLIHVANSLVANVRESDTVGRLGGDEFAVLLVQANDEAAQVKGAQLAGLITETPLKIDGRELRIQVAFGAYTFKAGEKPTDIIDQADRRMYANKRSSRAAAGGEPQAS